MNQVRGLITKTSILLAVVISLLTSLPALAAPKEKGIGEVNYSGLFGPSKNDHRTALEKARFNAIERYVANNSQSRVKLLAQKRGELEQQLDNLILSFNVADEDKDKKLKRLRIVIEAEINVNLLESLLTTGTDVANPDQEGSYMSFIFVAREQSSVKVYDDRKFARKDTGKSESGSDQQSSSDNGADYSGNVKKSATMEIGGSTTSKADLIEYKVSTTGEVNSAMSNIFTEAGFEVVEAEYLEGESNGQVSIDAFKRDYADGDLSGATLSSAASGLRGLEIPYFAIGTLDIGLRDKDPATGLTRVYVTVTGQVKSLKKRFPKTVASVGPVQYAGLGPNQTVARNNALKLAAQKAAEHLTAQLHAKQIR